MAGGETALPETIEEGRARAYLEKAALPATASELVRNCRRSIK